MAEELTLPRLAWNSDRSSHNKSPRKRVRLSSPVISSDPIFSSEDDPSVDNYSRERQKRRYRGPWYRQQIASDPPDQGSGEGQPKASRKVKRTLERQFDSGVWLGSDFTDNDEIVEGLVPTDGFLDPRLQGREFTLPVSSRSIALSPEVLAQRHIEYCLETGNETIDLSSRSLTVISNASLRPLASFACIPRVPSINEGIFSPLIPHLKIFLSSNLLTSLPGQLFDLENLSVLSLRGNLLQEMPSAIGNLRSLTELNLSQNSLRYLPYEILNLFANGSQLRSFQIHPNPFLTPSSSSDSRTKNLTTDEATEGDFAQTKGMATSQPQWNLKFRGRTETRYFAIDGNLLRGPAFPGDLSEQATTFSGAENDADTTPGETRNSVPLLDAPDFPPSPDAGYISRAPSLLEVSLNACSQSLQLPYLQALLPDDAPEIMHTLLSKVATIKASGGNKCTICGRNFIIPRTEWIEWWGITRLADDHGLPNASIRPENSRDVIESTVPLIRRGCSWLCWPDDLDREPRN